MKNLKLAMRLTGLLALFMVSTSLQAYNFLITGTVSSLQTGLPVAGHTVYIVADSSSGSYLSVQAITGTNGTYTATLAIPGTQPVLLTVITYGTCTPVQPYVQTVMSTPTNGSFTAIVNFQICTNNGTTSDCQAGYSYFVEPNPPSLSSTAVYLYDSSYAASNIVSWNWTTSNGQSSSLQNPVFYFPSIINAPYSICLTIATASGCTSTFCDTIYLYTNPNCSAEFSFSGGTNTTNPLSFSFIPTYPVSNLGYAWNFGDGTTSSLMNPVHSYTASGVYTVCLTVSGSGCSDTNCAIVYAIDSTGTGPCQAAFTGGPDSTVFCFMGEGYSFHGQNLGSGSVVAYQWEFSDGGTSTDPNPIHCYAYPGTYMVCLTITTANSAGLTCTSTICDSVFVGNINPTCEAYFTYAVETNPTTNTPVVYFYDSSFGPATSWLWEFGDGSTSSQPQPIHTYASPGSYEVCLTITTASGCVDSYCQTAFFGGNQTTCEAGFSFYLDTTVNCINCYHFINQSYSSSGSWESYWNFGDGGTSTSPNPLHTFSAPGTYEVCLTIFTADSCSHTVCHAVVVGNSGNYVVWGSVMATGTLIPGCAVLLMGANGSMAATTTGPNGMFEFPNIATGNYILYAIPSGFLYPTLAPTYYPSTLYWMQATQFAVTSNMPNMTIYLQNLDSAFTGPGSVGGNISWTSSSPAGGYKTISDNTVSGISIFLLDEFDQPLLFTATDESGQFLFSSIPYGTYKVYTELAGFTTIPAVVTIDENAPTILNIPIIISGTIISPGVLAMPNTSLANDWTLMGNPVSGEARLAFHGKNSLPLQVEIRTATGQVVFSEPAMIPVQNEIHIPVSHLPRGLYLIHLKNGFTSETLKMLK